MKIIFSLVMSNPYLVFPSTMLGWLGWGLLLIVIIIILRAGIKIPGVWNGERSKISLGKVFIFTELTLMVLFTNLFIGIMVFPEKNLIFPTIPLEPRSIVIFIFASVPWLLAAGISGIIPAAILGFISGAILGFWETHNIYTLLGITLAAILFTVFIRQRYRTSFYKFARHPLGSAVILIPFYLIISAYSALVSSVLPISSAIDEAITQSWVIALPRWVECLIGCLFVEVLYLVNRGYSFNTRDSDNRSKKEQINIWVGDNELVPAPAEMSIIKGFSLHTYPLMIIILILLITGGWIVSRYTAKQLMRAQLEDRAVFVSDALLNLFHTGQNILESISGPELLSLDTNQFQNRVDQNYQMHTFFRKIILLDNQLLLKSIYPNENFGGYELSAEEERGILLALEGQYDQPISISAPTGENDVYLSFLSVIRNEQDQIIGFLIGQTDLSTAPYLQSVLMTTGSDKVKESGGYIIDDRHIILFKSDVQVAFEDIVMQLPDGQEVYEEIVNNGSHYLVYSQPIMNNLMSIILVENADPMLQMAVRIAIPIISILAIIFIVFIIIVNHNFKKLSTPIISLSNIFDRHEKSSEINSPFTNGVISNHQFDEIGKLWKQIDRMQALVSQRQEEMDHIPLINWGAIASSNIIEGLQPILQSAINRGADSARLVINKYIYPNAYFEFGLDPEKINDYEKISKPSDDNENVLEGFGLGKLNNKYAILDKQLFVSLKKQDLLIIPNTKRLRSLDIPAESPRPGSIIGLAIYLKSEYFGTIWIAYEKIYGFSDEDIRFYKSLANQAAQLISNMSLIKSAEIGRRRLDAVLSSTPDPIMVFDEELRLIMVNTASKDVPGLIKSADSGKQLSEVIWNAELHALISSTASDQKVISRELTMNNGLVYLAIVYSIKSEDLNDRILHYQSNKAQSLGKVCLLRDISDYKQLDNLKSDFVNAVSHDLRSPLTLMHGYATMLQMVGKLNEQQESYLQKITTSIEEMNHLVSNLLDLGRIEAGIGLHIVKVCISELVESVLLIVKPKALQKKIEISYHEVNEGEKITIDADSTLIKQALLILVDNAIKYTGINGHVDIEVCQIVNKNVIREEEEAKRIRFVVKDNGIGIAPLDLPHIFEKFYRSDNREVEHRRGSGLGLAIVKSITERHHGKVWVESQLGIGSNFIVEIPVKQENLEKDAMENT